MARTVFSTRIVVRREHVDRSIELAEKMGLDESDQIYVSRLESSLGDGFRNVLGTPTAEDIVDEERTLLDGLRGLGLRASSYDLRGFVYG